MKGGRKLSADERILWGKVAKTAKPMPGRLEELLEFEADFPPAEDGSAPAASTGKPAPAGLSPGADAATPKQPKGVHHPLERPVKRKIARGRLALEARIDLHGMIQSEAHGILLDFLLRAHERGLRHVLVITGKGSSLGSEGALKRAVPLWFSKAEFRFLISSYEPAARQHGGEGALYVRLSRRGGEP
ncbi:DNA-nicking endonuclease, Smr domain [Rhizobium sp. RU35A]|uniref:Smr/MutS family protein n=1 Tax=Rhizobium straminoryzae TaxID=1387186 RepID=A0A549SMK1_9HYPH|nr:MULTISPECIES: Smr/MutS family protein [Rhizobium]TRL30856.1 Smr/MutS family protein [Rhizobium straminoryzae]SIR28672.1 DNA-nicking endonuclease, Smr domain [Rhizobium sp. RU35A]